MNISSNYEGGDLPVSVSKCDLLMYDGNRIKRKKFLT